MKKLIYILLFLFCVKNFYAQKFQDTIPFRNDLGLIIIPITFNGVEKQFAFDTGAQYSVAYGWAKESLKKTRKTLNIISSSDRRSRMRFYKSGKINLESRKITGHRILNAPRNEIFSCYQVDGILGVDIIQLFNWKIDYKNKRLIMYPSNFFPEEIKNMHELAFSYSDKRPHVYLTRKKNRFRFLLDTGAGGASNISTNNYKLTDIDEYQKAELFSGSFDVNGIFTSTKPKVIQFPETISKEVKIFPAVLYNNLKSSKIGNQLWKNKSLFLSLKSNQLYSSSPEIKEQFKSYSCSISYQNGKMRVMSILKDSEIWNLGVRQGDEILKFNDKVYTDFCTLENDRKKIIKSGKPFKITLKNGDSITISKVSIF